MGNRDFIRAGRRSLDVQDKFVRFLVELVRKLFHQRLLLALRDNRLVVFG
jgi:hypothetical protein